MSWARWVIYGIPMALTALTVWSARQASASRAERANEIVIASNESALPSFNPFLPTSGVDRQIAELTHEPLLRIGSDGRLAGGLVDHWSWSQTSHVWFANADYARQAASQLGALSEEDRGQLGITSIQTMGNELRLTLAKPGSQIEAKVMPVIASCGPLPVEFLRIEMNEDVRPHHEFFMKNAVERDQVKSVWFDGARACELAVSGETMKFVEELNLYYQSHAKLQAQVRPIGHAAMLHEPQLELALRKDARFSNGTEMKSSDVSATFKLVLDLLWPVRGRDALRLALRWDDSDPHILRATFKPACGSCIMAFVDLPVLPASWIMKHFEELKAGANPFAADPAPGTGPVRLESVNAHAITLTSHRRAQYLLNLSPEATRMGFAMGEVDGFWPSWRTAEDMSRDGAITLSSTPPRNRLLVLWNCRKPPLDDAKVREALGLAVDRPAMIRDLLHGQAVIEDGIFEPDLWFARKRAPQPFDSNQATQLLNARGWHRDDASHLLTRKGAAFHLELLTLAGNNERMALAERLSASWSALGITVTISAVTPDELVNLRLPEHRFDAVLLGLDFESSWDQTSFWHSSQAQGGLNFGGVADPELDEMLTKLRAEYDPERVPELAHAVEDRLESLHPFLSLFAGRTPFAIRSALAPRASKRTEATEAELRGLLTEPADKK
jgi:hypothetical protein